MSKGESRINGNEVGEVNGSPVPVEQCFSPLAACYNHLGAFKNPDAWAAPHTTQIRIFAGGTRWQRQWREVDGFEKYVKESI